jgi:hypothetical protein
MIRLGLLPLETGGDLTTAKPEDVIPEGGRECWALRKGWREGGRAREEETYRWSECVQPASERRPCADLL